MNKKIVALPSLGLQVSTEVLLERIGQLEGTLGEVIKENTTLKKGKVRDRIKIKDLEAENRNLRRRLLTADWKTTSERYDSLTGFFRRVPFVNALEQLRTVCQRKNLPLCLLFVDIDCFKSVNDTCGGHAVGDRMLKKLSQILRSVTRESDVIGRWGGEEIVIVLFDTDIDMAIKHAEKIREKIALSLRVIGTQDGTSIHVRRTVSIGVAKMEDNDTHESLVHKADRAMYEAKRDGRNCVRSFL